MLRTTLGIVGALGIASIASAADLPVKAPAQAPLAPVYSWTGFYVGGHVGALWTRADGRTDPPAPGREGSTRSSTMGACSDGMSSRRAGNVSGPEWSGGGG